MSIICVVSAKCLVGEWAGADGNELRYAGSRSQGHLGDGVGEGFFW